MWGQEVRKGKEKLVEVVTQLLLGHRCRALRKISHCLKLPHQKKYK